MGRQWALRNLQAKLRDYADRILNEGEASSAELRTVLEAVNASPHPRCSAAEIGYFRNLIFESQYAKDVGRLRNGTVNCSATLGVVQQPSAERNADFCQRDGTSLDAALVPMRTATGLPSRCNRRIPTLCLPHSPGSIPSRLRCTLPRPLLTRQRKSPAGSS